MHHLSMAARKTVYYDTLIPAQSLLRRMPLAIQPLMRLRVDALVFAADALSHNWHTLNRAATAIGPSAGKMTGIHRAAMLSASWAIVDELDAVRQIVQSMIEQGEETGLITKDLLQKLEPVQRLRNKRRHLSGNLKNIASKIVERKSGRSPLLGSLSWVHCSNPEVGNAHILVVQAGMLHGGERVKLVNPDSRDFDPPVGMFQLDAFETVLVIKDPITAYHIWLDAQTERWTAQIEKQIEEYVSKGADRDEVEATMGGDFAFSLPLKVELRRREGGS